MDPTPGTPDPTATPTATPPSPAANTAVERLYLLDFGTFRVHHGDPHGPGGRTIGIPGYLIRAGGATVLVDGGFPARYADPAERARAAREDGLGAFGEVLRLTRDNLPEAQLARAGVRPEEVTHLVLTHSDIDHIGAVAELPHAFPHATLVVSAADRALPRPRYFGARRPLAWPEDVPTQRVEHDCELLPGVTLLVTPGHAPGHLSLLLRLPESGAVLLVADAIARPAELTEGFAGAFDEAQARASAERLLEIAEREEAWVVFGHDPGQWRVLRKAPEFYR